MKRTQIYLTEEQAARLERRSRATGTTVSQLIRQAIDAAFGPRRNMSQVEKVRLAKRTVGAWKTFPESGADFVERLRGSRRLGRLHDVR